MCIRDRLEALEIGDASEADCRLDSLDSAWPVLNQLVCIQVDLGAFIMSVLTNGLRLLSFSTEWQKVLTGVIIIIAVYIDIVGKRKKLSLIHI